MRLSASIKYSTLYCIKKTCFLETSLMHITRKHLHVTTSKVDLTFVKIPSVCMVFMISVSSLM